MPRILHIEDVDALREMIQIYLELQGFEVTGAVSGEAGIQALEASEFDAILLDLNLPGISGERVLGWLAIHRPYLVSRVIVTTGSFSNEALEARLAGFEVPVLLKPFLLEELLQQLTRVALPTKARPTNSPRGMPSSIVYRHRL